MVIYKPVYVKGVLTWGSLKEKMLPEDVYAFMQAVKRNLCTYRKGTCEIPKGDFDDLMKYNYTLLLSTDTLCIKGAFDASNPKFLWLIVKDTKGIHQHYFHINRNDFEVRYF